MLELSHAEHVVHVQILGFLEEGLGFVEDLLSDHVDGLVVLNHYIALVAFVGWLEQDDLLGQLFKFKVINLLLVLLALSLGNGVHL